jgi:hypothetical protein
MLTRGGVAHQYGEGGYYPAPYHVVFLTDSYPGEGGRPDVARIAPVELNAAVTIAGGAGFRPYVGMDPSDPGTWSRPYNPQRGMFGRLHDDTDAAALGQRQRTHKARAQK